MRPQNLVPGCVSDSVDGAMHQELRSRVVSFRRNTVKILLENKIGDRLTLVLEERPAEFRVYAVHSKLGRGASSRHRTEGMARHALLLLENRAYAAGWELRIEIRKFPDSGSMKVIDGIRFFRDQLSGEWFEDGSNWRPPTVAMPEKNTDTFSLETLPVAWNSHRSSEI